MKKISVVLILTCAFVFNISLITYADTMEIDFYKVFENHGAVILITDMQTGDIEYANEAASNFYGYQIQQLESMKLSEINTLTPEETEKEMKAAADEKRNYFIYKHRLASGDIRTVEVYSYPATDVDRTLLVSIIHDISAKTQLAEKSRIMANVFIVVLSGLVIFLLLVSFWLFKNSRKLKAKNLEINNANELRKTFVDADASLIYLKDENLKYIFVNRAVENFYNKGAAEIIGYDDFGVSGEEFANIRRKTDLNVIEKRTVVVDEVRWENRVFQTTKFPVKLLNGKYGIGAYVKDVTEEYVKNKQLQEKQYELEEQNTIIEELNSQLEDENSRNKRHKEILQAILDSLGAGIMMVDPSGKIIFINKAWKEIFNYLDFGQNSQYNDSFYMNSDAWSNTELFIQNIMTGMVNSQEVAEKLFSLAGDGESSYDVDLEQTNPVKRFLNLYSNPCISHTNHNFGRVFVTRDISHQKEVDRLKLELISTVSHELRTPMSSILGFSELLLTRRLSEERNKEYIGIIHSEAKRLTDLINDFLDIQRMESGKQVFNKQYNSIVKMIEDSTKLFENIGEKYSIIYEKSINTMPQIYCDRDKILQVLSNFLSNAVKYSPDGGEIKVDLTVENGRVKVSVTDHGLGIPENVMDKLFTKFFRVDNDDRRKIGGSGLGLAICKEIIRAHGGEIGVESIYGQGSTFYFYLPYSGNCNSTVSVEKVADAGYSGRGGNLLIVEDDISMVKLIKEILKDEGLEMHAVNSGEEALEFVARYCYKLIILDIALSGQMNGWDVLKELKNNQVTTDIPIIISSVYENKGIASQSDIADYLVKPFEPAQLVGMVQKASVGKLNSKMMIKSGDGLTEVVLEMLSSRKIGVKQIEHSGNILIITLDGEEGLENE